MTSNYDQTGLQRAIKKALLKEAQQRGIAPADATHYEVTTYGVYMRIGTKVFHFEDTNLESHKEFVRGLQAKYPKAIYYHTRTTERKEY